MLQINRKLVQRASVKIPANQQYRVKCKRSNGLYGTSYVNLTTSIMDLFRLFNKSWLNHATKSIHLKNKRKAFIKVILVHELKGTGMFNKECG